MAQQRKADPAKPARPRYGLQPPAGWKIAPSRPQDPLCVHCNLPACLLDPKGDPDHPGCWEKRRRRR